MPFVHGRGRRGNGTSRQGIIVSIQQGPMQDDRSRSRTRGRAGGRRGGVMGGGLNPIQFATGRRPPIQNGKGTIGIIAATRNGPSIQGIVVIAARRWSCVGRRSRDARLLVVMGRSTRPWCRGCRRGRRRQGGKVQLGGGKVQDLLRSGRDIVIDGRIRAIGRTLMIVVKRILTIVLNPFLRMFQGLAKGHGPIHVIGIVMIVRRMMIGIVKHVVERLAARLWLLLLLQMMGAGQQGRTQTVGQ